MNKRERSCTTSVKKTVSKKRSSNPPFEDFEEYLHKRLQDPALAISYLNEALADDDKRVFPLALRHVIAAQGGDMTALSEQTNLNRQNLYRILSKKGNPRWESITSLCDALGYQVQLHKK